MPTPRRIYLDNAATSWPKPQAVYDAVDRYQREVGAPAGRGAYAAGSEVARVVAACRRDIADLIGAGDPRRIAFGFNGTDVLNIALHGLLGGGGHVVTTVVEHNSVLRPLRWLQDHRGVSVTYIDCNAEGVVAATDVADAIRPDTSAVVVTHASNVTGAIQPVAEIGRSVRETEACFLVDAAQSMGHVDVDVDEMQIDLLAASGHKGLLGPLGSGVLYIAPEIEDKVDTFRQGGTGTQSEADVHPCEMPHKFEAGNLNVPAIFGLAAGVAYLKEQGCDQIRQHETALSKTLRQGLREIEGVTIYGPEEGTDSTAVVSFNLPGFQPQESATLLDSAFGIEVRAGLHCAPRMHQALGTDANGGTVRISLGPFNIEDDVTTALEAVRQIASSSEDVLET